MYVHICKFYKYTKDPQNAYLHLAMNRKEHWKEIHLNVNNGYV